MNDQERLAAIKESLGATPRELAYATCIAMKRDGAFIPGMTWVDGNDWLFQNIKRVKPVLIELRLPRSDTDWPHYLIDLRPRIDRNFMGGPALILRNGRTHWLTLWERIRLRLGLETALTLEKKRWRW